MATAIDDKIIEDSEIVIGTDTRGDVLTQSIIRSNRNDAMCRPW